MTDTLREKIKHKADENCQNYGSYSLSPQDVIALLDEHCGNEERLKHLLLRAIGLLRDAMFEHTENKRTAAIVIEEGLRAVGDNTKQEG